MSRTSQGVRATVDDLYQIDGNAELIDGRIIPLMPTGHLPNQVAGRIYRRLADFVDDRGTGFVYTDSMGFTVPELASRRESFSPDVSFLDGEAPVNRMRFVEGPPTFAVEVRSDVDYGPAADRSYAAKRADYFEAGILVVWDIDPVGEVIRSYRHDRPEAPTTFTQGQIADAEPAVPGWRLEVDSVFPPRP
ncbi:Uma2 family endonuclease [Tautonia rosea]|uniref:Uma2 family endonuclease n=1 Tax=Tautonia rosea TaxID=2728037 RepID=UPI0014732A81|nr:Uma2 family endonuclease [Tautonia rosea]